METLNDDQFQLLGERMKDAWDESVEDRAVWLNFKAEIELISMCARWDLSPEGYVNLRLEEHESAHDAFWAAFRNDDSIKPLRSVGWRQTGKGWEALT